LLFSIPSYLPTSLASSRAYLRFTFHFRLSYMLSWCILVCITCLLLLHPPNFFSIPTLLLPTIIHPCSLAFNFFHPHSLAYQFRALHRTSCSISIRLEFLLLSQSPCSRIPLAWLRLPLLHTTKFFMHLQSHLSCYYIPLSLPHISLASIYIHRLQLHHTELLSHPDFPTSIPAC
jgi:hypothetical protein